jgi:hypothetical protein
VATRSPTTESAVRVILESEWRAMRATQSLWFGSTPRGLSCGCGTTDGEFLACCSLVVVLPFVLRQRTRATDSEATQSDQSHSHLLTLTRSHTLPFFSGSTALCRMASWLRRFFRDDECCITPSPEYNDAKHFVRVLLFFFSPSFTCVACLPALALVRSLAWRCALPCSRSHLMFTHSSALACVFCVDIACFFFSLSCSNWRATERRSQR